MIESENKAQYPMLIGTDGYPQVWLTALPQDVLVTPEAFHKFCSVVGIPIPAEGSDVVLTHGPFPECEFLGMYPDGGSRIIPAAKEPPTLRPGMTPDGGIGYSIDE